MKITGNTQAFTVLLDPEVPHETAAVEISTYRGAALIRPAHIEIIYNGDLRYVHVRGPKITASGHPHQTQSGTLVLGGTPDGSWPKAAVDALALVESIRDGA